VGAGFSFGGWAMTELPVASNAPPSNVVLFEQLWYLSLGIGVIQSILQWHVAVALAHAAGRGIGFILFIQVFVFAMSVWFVWLIARRRKNWARWIWLSICGLGMLGVPPVLSRLLHSNPLVAVLPCVQALAQIVALHLIFTGDARAWFKSN
jgi:hypothetical protein